MAIESATIKFVHIEELYQKLNPNNPKIHNIDLITNSILEYGFYSVIVVNKNGVISAGNGRTKALMALYQAGATVKGIIVDWQIPVIESDLTGDELYKFLVDDNLAGVISGGLSQLNNAQLVDNLNPDNLPLSISKADYDFMLKVFANDFKATEEPKDDKPKEAKQKSKKIIVTFLDETLYEEIFAELDKLLESYILAEQIRMK